jgi:energy-converting hydrogenase Eha subunit A
MNEQYIAYLAVFIQAMGSAYYLFLTIKGEVKPNRVSWLIWGIAPMLASTISYLEGAGFSALPVFFSGFLPFLVFCASFINPKAYWKLGFLDYTCGILSLVTLIFWGITKHSVAAIGLLILVDAIAFFPSIIKAWKFPETETYTSYLATAIAAIMGLCIVEQWVFTEYAFLAYLAVICGAMTVIVVRKKLNFRKTL